MQILLASAKIMRESFNRYNPELSLEHTPRFQSKASEIAREMSMFSPERLCELFSCSLDIARLNSERFSVLGSDEAQLMPAIFAYNGQAYRHLKADYLSEQELKWADGHLWISSCMYGLLRPLDLINTYRMEGRFALKCTGNMKVSESWRDVLTKTLLESVEEDDGILLYLDTEEFRSLFDWKRVVQHTRRIIEPKFHVLRKGKLTTPSVWAKTCRGAMARYVISNQVDKAEEILKFSYEGFSFDREYNCWLRRE